MSSDLRSRAVRGMGQLGLGSAVGKVISLGTTLILARILSPAEYGLMAVAMIVIGFIGFFNEVGIGSAIVQKAQLTSTEVNGCFAIAILLSTILVALTIASSGSIAVFYGFNELKNIISVLSSGFILGAMTTVPIAFLRKEMLFKNIAGLNILGTLVQSASSLCFALLGYGVWSLVWGSVLGSIVFTTAVFLISPWRPKGKYGIREAKALVIYGLHITSTRIFWYVYTNADKAIIGKILGLKALGIYDMAFSLATLPSSQVTTLVTNVASPLFSKLQSNVSDLSAVLLKLTRGVAYVTYPALLGMLVCSRELILVVLGPKWIDVLVPFAALCLMGLIKSVDPLLSQVLTSTGNAKKLSVYTAMCSIAMLVGVTVGAAIDGLRGVSIVWVTVYPLLTIWLLKDVCNITGMSIGTYYRNLLPVLLGATVMSVVVLVMRGIAFKFIETTHIILAIEIIVGVTTYFFWIVYMDRKGVSEIRQVLIDIGFASHHLNRWPFVQNAKSS